MYLREDTYGSLVPDGGKMKAYDVKDFDTIILCLKAIRGRMMGISWEDLSKRFNTTGEELHEACAMFLGDIVADYDYDMINGLPSKYSDLFGRVLGKTAAQAMENDVIGRLVPYNDFIEYTDEIAIDRYLHSWEKNFGMKWKDFVVEYKDKEPDLDKFDLPSDDFDIHGFSMWSLLHDYRTYGNDHSSPGHASWRCRMPFEEDPRYPDSYRKDKYGLPAEPFVRSLGFY